MNNIIALDVLIVCTKDTFVDAIYSVIISDAIINDRIDINGNKPKIMFSENASSGKKSGLPVHILSPDLELNNIKLSLTNDYKKNETYITINQSLFNLELDQNLISLSGNLSGNLDSLKSNGFTLFSNKKVEGNDQRQVCRFLYHQ